MEGDKKKTGNLNKEKQKKLCDENFITCHITQNKIDQKVEYMQRLEKMNYKGSKNKINSRENNTWKVNKGTKAIQHIHNWYS